MKKYLDKNALQDFTTKLIAKLDTIYPRERNNPNLLDNPWFTVNQRGWTSGAQSNDNYCVDRWKMSGPNTSTIAVSTSGLSLTAINEGYASVINYTEIDHTLDGKTLTMSVMLADGTIYSNTFVRTYGTDAIKRVGALEFKMYSSGNVAVVVYDGNTITIRAVKLELGSISTLANDVAPDYELELQKCRGHVLVVGGDSTTVLTGFMGSTTLMRGNTLTDLNFTPTTISMTGSFYVYAGGSLAGVSSVALMNSNKHNIDVTTSAALQNNAIAIMRGGDSNSKIIISDGLG